MTERHDPTEVLSSLSVLYELSLSIGTSLDVDETCNAFVRTLMARHNLEFGAVWVRRRFLDDTDGGDDLLLLHGNPKFRIRETVLPADHAVVRALGDGDACSVGASDPAFAECITERGIVRGRYAIFRLGDVGILKLFDTDSDEPFGPEELSRLRNVARKFGVSVQACLAHRRAMLEIDRRRAMEDALRVVVEGTAALGGEEFFRALVRDLATTLGVRGAVVSRLLDGPVTAAHVLALWVDGEFREMPDHVLEGTPCGRVARDGRAVSERDIEQFLPPLLKGRGLTHHTGVPLRDAAGRLIGLLGVLGGRGLFEEKQRLAILGVFAARAAGEIERMASEQERRRLEAGIRHAQKLESLGVLASGIAYDFNNLLTGILGHAGLARLQTVPDSPARRAVEQVEKTTLRAAELCRQLLAYSGKGIFTVEPVDLNALVRDMADLLELTRPKNVQVAYELQDGLPCVEADAAQVRQVIMNLVTNASEAMGVAGGCISVRTRFDEWEATELRDIVGGDLPTGRYVTLDVADTGIGMDEDTKSRVFDPFFTTKFTGRGLGLAAVLGIVRGHRGGIRIDSAAGRGTTCHVLFPPATSARRDPATTPVPATERRNEGLAAGDVPATRTS